MRHALYLPPFGPLSDPAALADLARGAEDRGWDGVFLWDHILRPAPEPPELADATVCLAAMAVATGRLRLGPMVTPLVRRRPQKVAREIATLDRLAAGRITLGLGLGVDSGGELTRFGEITDARARGDLLDEGTALVAALLTGEPVSHRGRHFVADDVRFLPAPVQHPRVPIWLASRQGAVRPTRRAARYDGLFAIEIDLDGLAGVVEVIRAERGNLDGFDLAVIVDADTDLDAWKAGGATWAMWAFEPGATVDDVRRRIDDPPRP
jgi:alkanesulfonate monooxygenase SsuD/methylene tetrahydromethanopterin reductase-like flavin-dependent oxidoreductase (luciferase family)